MDKTGKTWNKRQKITEGMLIVAEAVSREDFPLPGTGLTPNQESELTRTAIQYGILRQCSIGDHNGCTDLEGRVCQCPCHRRSQPKEITMSLVPEIDEPTPAPTPTPGSALNFDTEPPEDVTTAVFTALGAVSACWENLQGAGVFESTRAKQIGDELMEYLYAQGLPRA